jgi:DNA-binding MarR family transcriptional regulator
LALEGEDVQEQQEQQVMDFIQANIGSVYALELLLLIKRYPNKTWRAGDLIRELRSSGTAVSEALSRLVKAGFVSENPAGRYVFAPASSKHERLAADIEQAYAHMPMSVMQGIAGTRGAPE